MRTSEQSTSSLATVSLPIQPCFRAVSKLVVSASLPTAHKVLIALAESGTAYAYSVPLSGVAGGIDLARVRHQVRYAVLSLCRASWMIVTKP